jgi:hypothetical protein
MSVTHAMAHRFINAPHHLTPVAALRWAQVRAMGGSDALARAVLGTRLGRVLENEAFWETVVLYLVNQPELRLEHVRPIVDFVQRAKFESRHMPDLSLHGRTLLSVRGLLRPERRNIVHGVRSWPAATLRPLFFLDEGHAWTIRELCTSQELAVEGADMHHCVASYVRACASGRSSVWSMQLEAQRRVTIEVDVARRAVRQAKCRFNAAPDAREKRVLGEWACREGLSVPSALRA